MRALVGLVLLSLTACTPGSATRGVPISGTPAQPSPATSPTSHQPAIAILENGSNGSKSTLTIASPEGRTLAQASFNATTHPFLGMVPVFTPISVRVAAGAAFYAEQSGQVHRLDANGTASLVATFSIATRQQMLTYAVSPDGRQLIAIVVTAPAVHNPPPQDISEPVFQDGARWSLELEHATAGGSTDTVLKTDLGPAAGLPSITTIAGWDDRGPVAQLNTQLGAQQPLPAILLTGSALIHLGLDGTHLDQLGGSNCHPLDELLDGTTLCSTSDWNTGTWPQSYEVRTGAGQVLWKQGILTTNNGTSGYYNPVLSPNGQRIAAVTTIWTPTTVSTATVFANGSNPAVVADKAVAPLSQQVVGWVDADTLAVTSGTSGTVELISLGDPQHPRDTGIKGVFVGAV